MKHVSPKLLWFEVSKLEISRGLSFTPEDDALLARTSVHVSSQRNEQNAPIFWNNVWTFFVGSQTSANIGRTADSLRCRWHTLKSTDQKYLAA